MTREEEIREAAKEFVFGDKPETSDFFDKVKIDCFYYGAKWAYEHPNLYNDEKYHTVQVSYLDELVRNTVLYEEFLEKACGWLKDWDRKTMYELSMIMGNKFIEDFRKAMVK